MTRTQIPPRIRGVLLIAALIAQGEATSSGAKAIEVTEITPNVLVFATGGGNVVASVGPDGALLVGTPSRSSTAEISRALAARTKSAFRYVVVFPEDSSRSEGDAGWGERGAFVAMQENALETLGGHKMGAPGPLPPRLLALKADRPRIAFSQVITFDLNGEGIHIVHQPAGYSNADAVAHFHVANVIYLGEVFPGDGYPAIDAANGGTLDGLAKALVWTGSTVRVVPARGKPTTGIDVAAFRDMISAVRERVSRLIDRGLTEDQAVSEHPTANFDARWGKGRLTPDAFTREVYAAVKASRAK
ncbi:MAG: hypothetical protein JO340_15860 [Acidobacteriaceae bacterium]|nr:hypothetical protein [Acidobacteriaceae bacterium]